MSHNVSLDKTSVIKCLQKGTVKLLFDFDIISSMREEVAQDLKRNPEFPYGCSCKKIIIVKQDDGLHFVGLTTFDSFHVLIGVIYSLFSNEKDIFIGGGTNLRIDNNDGKEEIQIGGMSSSFHGVSYIDVEQIIKNFSTSVNIKVDKEEMEISVIYQKYSYERLHSISTNI